MLVGVGPPGAGDALAFIDDGDDGASTDPPRRLFVPSPLPCGECPYCSRALTAACRAPESPLSVDVNCRQSVRERFVTPIDQAAWANLPPAVVAACGLAAEVLDATARSGLGPGDTAIWIGAEPWVSLGAAFCARRSCRTFTVGAARLPRDESIVRLATGDDPPRWQSLLAEAEAASGAGHGRPERRIFVYGAATGDAQAALRLAAPGTTVSFRRGVPATLDGLDRSGPLRMLIGGGYHPDLVPEALAVLARGELDISPVIREVALPELDDALNAFASGRDARLPVVRLDTALVPSTR
jgi:threonine dehydrogenase-like Zn-dependent dehydrogenase